MSQIIVRTILTQVSSTITLLLLTKSLAQYQKSSLLFNSLRISGISGLLRDISGS